MTPEEHTAPKPLAWLLRKLLAPWGTQAITPGKRTYYLIPNPSETLRAHEAVHRRQCREMGWLRYVTTYLYQCARYGYRGSAMEREARREAGQDV